MGHSARERIRSFFGSKKAGNPHNKGSEYRRHHRRDNYSSTSPSPERERAPKTERKRRKHVVVFSPVPDQNKSISPMEVPDWPPGDLNKEDSVPAQEALEVIAAGAPIFKGFRSPVPNLPNNGEGNYLFFAIADEVPGDGYDAAKVYHAAFLLCSFLFSGPGVAEFPWETLEQPSLAFSYGIRPGTITLNSWVGLSGCLDPVVHIREPDTKLRGIEMEQILNRLRYLEGGFEEDYPDLMYTNIYGNSGILKDKNRYSQPQKAIERQIADLITVLGRHDWIDFSRPENWVVGKLFKDVRMGDRGRGYRFFHQLLVSMELDVRICSKSNDAAIRQKLMAALPAPIAYSVVVARRWREGVKIEEFVGGDADEKIKLTFRNKKQQLKSIRKFARMLRWKNLDEVESVLEHRNRELPRVEERSSDALTYVSGVILPGPSLPWLLINALIDCDSETDHELDTLTHLRPHTGFQYKASTFWSSSSIVGKVLAPTAQEIGGWIGPCLQTVDLKRTEVARLRQRPPGLRVGVDDIKTMEIRSDPLGPDSSLYPLDEYEIPAPDVEAVNESVKIEKLTLKKLVKHGEDGRVEERDGPSVYDAGITFAIDGISWPVRLNYNIEFIAGYPCTAGPHPIFYDYRYRAIPASAVLTIQDWATLPNKDSNLSGSHRKRNISPSGSMSSEEEDELDEDKVLVIEAFGPPDSEVLARAYCSHWRLNAVVADVERTCMACAIREAYAACVRVVIMVRGEQAVDLDA